MYTLQNSRKPYLGVKCKARDVGLVHNKKGLSETKGNSLHIV
jgi:hypothetical protein